MYEFITGPLLWAAFLVFFGGCLFKTVWFFRLAKRDASAVVGTGLLPPSAL